MTELLEAIAVDIAGSDSTKCPFDCGCTCDATNNFSRAESFGKKVTSGEPTIRFRRTENGDFKSDTTPIDAKYPPKNKKSFPNDWGWAAHHLIPVSTLRDHKLRKYLDKGVKGSKVSCDVGYEVNGVTNGKWLIASYSGMQKALKDPEVDEMVRSTLKRIGIDIADDKSTYSTMSSDAKVSLADPMKFKEWLFATMEIYGRQFHDSHGPYEDFVKLALNKVRANVRKSNKECPGGSQCKAASKKPMAPHRIARRLDHISGRLGRHLKGPASTWKNPIFTSAFSKMYATEVQSGK